MTTRRAKRATRKKTSMLVHDGRDIPIRTQRDRRARRMTLRIDPKDGCVVLTLPTYVSLSEGLGFAKSNSAWLAQRLDELLPKTPFADDSVIPYLGHPILIRHFPLAGPEPVLANDILHVPGPETQVAESVRAWLMEEARREISVRVAVKAALLRRKATPPFRLTDPKARWGSCSSEGRLCFSWRLILAPVRVLDYVVAHEVAHLSALDHSPRFYRICDSLTPYAEFAQDWLARHGASLLRYG